MHGLKITRKLEKISNDFKSAQLSKAISKGQTLEEIGETKLSKHISNYGNNYNFQSAMYIMQLRKRFPHHIIVELRYYCGMLLVGALFSLLSTIDIESDNLDIVNVAQYAINHPLQLINVLDGTMLLLIVVRMCVEFKMAKDVLDSA